jgi:hypothetical protein
LSSLLDLVPSSDKGATTTKYSHSRPLIKLKQFDKADFGRRWTAARRAALSQVLADEKMDGDEIKLLAAVPDDKRDDLLRAVFDASRRLALSAVRFLGVTWEVEDFQAALAEMASCLSGTWTAPSASVRVLSRNGCEAAKTCGSLVCDFWREAIDGITTGAGATERFARHASVGHRDATCIDVWFDDASEPPKNFEAAPRWAPVPDTVAKEMAVVVKEAATGKAVLTLLGIAEGVLFYRLETNKSSPICSGGTQIWHYRIRAGASALGLTTKDVSPTAVLSQKRS